MFISFCLPSIGFSSFLCTSTFSAANYCDVSPSILESQFFLCMFRRSTASSKEYELRVGKDQKDDVRPTLRCCPGATAQLTNNSGVSYHITTRCHIPEYHDMNLHRREILKPPHNTFSS